MKSVPIAEELQWVKNPWPGQDNEGGFVMFVYEKLQWSFSLNNHTKLLKSYYAVILWHQNIKQAVRIKSALCLLLSSFII